MADSARTLSDLIAPRSRVSLPSVGRDALLVVGGSILVALLAQLTIPLPYVPLTGQTLGVLLVGAALGWRRGGLALLLYLAEGVAGLPVFAEGKAGIIALLGPTGGYLIGFVFAAALVGWLAEHGWDRLPWLMALAMLLGNLVIYAFGLPWLAFVAHLTPAQTLSFGLYPFWIGDAIKLVFAAALLPGVWALVGRAHSTRGPDAEQEETR